MAHISQAFVTVIVTLAKIEGIKVLHSRKHCKKVGETERQHEL